MRNEYLYTVQSPLHVLFLPLADAFPRIIPIRAPEAVHSQPAQHLQCPLYRPDSSSFTASLRELEKVRASFKMFSGGTFPVILKWGERGFVMRMEERGLHKVSCGLWSPCPSRLLFKKLLCWVPSFAERINHEVYLQIKGGW